MKKFILIISLIIFPIISFAAGPKPDKKTIPAGKVVVYPNPWIPEARVTYSNSDNGDTTYHGHLSADGWIKFAGMQTDTGALRIYDTNGNLVKNFRWNASNSGERGSFPVAQYTVDGEESQEHYDLQQTGSDYIRIIHWDGKNNNYEYVQSGVYIWILQEDGGKKHHGKLVIVR